VDSSAKLKVMLREKAYLLFFFNDPVIALEHFTANKDAYALVIADLRMPSLNGLVGDTEKGKELKS
jgi:CheY-like chemotaxis protein